LGEEGIHVKRMDSKRVPELDEGSKGFNLYTRNWN